MSKKRIAIFSPYLNTLGGGERYILTLAECLSDDYQIEVFWNNKEILKKAEDRFNLKLNKIKINSIDFGLFTSKKTLFKKVFLTKQYQAFFFVSDGSIPLGLAKKNFVHFQVPFTGVQGKSVFNNLKLKFINQIICNSEFTKKYIDQEFGIKSRVIYPPVAIENFKSIKKNNLILSVGRFDNLSQNKRQDFLIETFKKLTDRGLNNWELILCGGIGSKEGEEFYNQLKKQIGNYKIRIIKDIDFKYLKSIYGKSKIYWQATGFGDNSKKHPEKMEHFGIATVEAMASGCTPIVINAGGQTEIVENNKSGFLWEKQSELISLTLKITKNEKLREKIARQAIQRSKKFSKRVFCQQVKQLLNKDNV